MCSHSRAAQAAGTLSLVVTLLATGCYTSAQGGGSAFSSVRFTLDSHGDIQVLGASRTAVSPAGSHAVTGGRAYPFERPAGRLLVVLRHRPEVRVSRGAVRRSPPPEEASVETGFLVDTGGWALAELDGHPLQWLRRDTIRVDTTKGAAGERVRLTLSGPHGGRSGQPVAPPVQRGCEGGDRAVNRRVVLPEAVPGTAVAELLARLRERCLDVQYASLPGGARRGTVRRVEVPLAARMSPTAVIPPLDGVPVPGRLPGDRVLTDPSRPTTVVVAR